MKHVIILLLMLVSFTSMAKESLLPDSSTVTNIKESVVNTLDSAEYHTVSTIDSFIDKYGPTVQAAIGEIFDFVKVTGEEAIRIFYNYILFTYSWYFSIFFIPFLLFFILWLKSFFSKEDWWEGNDFSWHGIKGFFRFLIMIILGCCTFTWLYHLLLALFIPEAAIILEAIEIMNDSK